MHHADDLLKSDPHDGAEHTCRTCHKQYLCDLPGWACPTVNGDENADTCTPCEIKYADEYQRWYDEVGGES